MNEHLAGPQGQRGAFSIMAAVVLLMALMCLALVVDSGRLYMEQRALQRTADMAALEAVSRNGLCSDGTAPLHAREAASRHGLGNANTTAECIQTYVEAGVTRIGAADSDSRTVLVTIAKTVPASLVFRAGCLLGACEGDNRIQLQARAVAGKNEPIAVFSVGSRLATVNPGGSLLGPTLNALGLDLDETGLAGYNGLAAVSITPRGLLEALGIPIATDITVGDLESLLRAERLSLGEILDASVSAVERSDLLGLNTTLLNDLGARLGLSNIGQLEIPLLRQDDGTPGIFASLQGPEGTPSASAAPALEAQVNALSLLTSAIGVASNRHALQTDLKLNLLGLATTELKLGLIEPPSIAVGGVGSTAYTAQLRTFLEIKTQGAGLLGNLLSTLGVRVDIPLVIDLVSAKGELTEMCSPGLYHHGQEHAEIEVSGNIAQICMGGVADSDELFSRKNACTDYLTAHDFLEVRLLGLNLLSLSGPPIILDALPIPAAPTLDNPLELAEADIGSLHNPLALGDTLGNLSTTLIPLLLGQGAPPGNTPGLVARNLWEDTAHVCSTTSAACHRERMNQLNTNLQNEFSGSTGLLGGVLELVGNLVGGLLGTLLGGNGCTMNSGLLGIGGVSADRCVALIEGELAKSPGNGPVSGAVTILLELLDSLLGPVLNAVGELLNRLLGELLGIRLGVIDVHLQHLDCGNARLLI
ncbi:hypothetical protein DNJ95_18885 [Stutzerimonas kirkiae]|uniref:Putative Flp pilus-assembly TadG-like N-terminal domain-containing protein n=1 Tax=Stutzerimonas kirkiae TaxID=2211392 RepID=A0A4V2KBX6_9GAMM|nr:pilus assembly protein TadG-related protein [Stutzerimonas kirkiae]TBU89544.1 hypothetical protein DNJ96_17540 [Stutzerimonas kirkiae]TBU97872.1 hypothetical protein DNJ95_18885 [Stutzerimonas kirkiae]